MSIAKFKQFLINEEKKVYFTFGRMNPPTRGHEKLLETLGAKAGKHPIRVFLSQSYDKKKNPLLYENKIKYARKSFPRFARSIVKTPDVKNFLEAATSLYDEGFKKVVMVVGEDRKMEFDLKLNEYNGKKGSHGFYLFESISVVSAGQRDPDSDTVSGVSSSKLREAAHEGNFIKFSQGISKSLTNPETKKLFNEIRSGLGLSEMRDFKNDIKMDPLSEAREKYIKGELFEPGDTVIIKKTEEVAEVTMLGTNYVIVEAADGRRLRKWLNDVEKI